MNRNLILSVFCIAALLLHSCSEKELTPVLSLSARAGITAPTSGSSWVLLETEADQMLPSITWSAANYGFDASITYVVEVDRVGNNFAEPITIGTVVSGTSLDLTVGGLNGVLLAQGLPGEAATSLEMRVASDVNDDVATAYSDVVTIEVTPYTVVIDYPKLQVPGNYQGWDPANETTVIYSAGVNDSYEGYIYLGDPAPEFKFTQGPSWDVNWGDDDGDGVLDPGGANLTTTESGMYRLNVDLAALTYTVAKTDWGLIGSATPNGWDADQDLTYDAATNRYMITLDLVAGEIKFRANDDWAINMGDTNANGSLEYDGDNIVVAEDGNYTIELVLSEAVYTYSVTKN